MESVEDNGGSRIWSMKAFEPLKDNKSRDRILLYPKKNDHILLVMRKITFVIEDLFHGDTGGY